MKKFLFILILNAFGNSYAHVMEHVQRGSCGLDGTIEERLQDCSYQADAEKEGFVLVSRTNKLEEIRKEIATGLLWSEPLPNTVRQYYAGWACRSLKELSGVTGLKWRLPSIDEYRVAEKNGIRKALQKMNYWFWSSSVEHPRAAGAWRFNGRNGKTYNGYRGNYFLVRCVADI